MFTLDQIKEAHAKVKSGADFPKYIQDLKALGVSEYTTYVTDGHAEYKGENNQFLISDKKYSSLKIAVTPDFDMFKIDLKAHQEGRTNYQTFCEDSAKSGVNKWTVDIFAKTCTYYDINENYILEEKIPI